MCDVVFMRFLDCAETGVELGLLIMLICIIVLLYYIILYTIKSIII
jgi:hypothetical protein